jgi:sugar/nucleoside kinase (ribokinase family)
LYDDYCEELLTFLRKEFGEFTVVLMPDFFLDRLISLKWNVNTFSRKMEHVARKKGGSIDEIAQTELRGGNAVNTASALAALGVKVIPIVCTDKLGLQIIKYYLEPYKVDLSHVKIFNEASITTAIEFETKDGKVNIMLRNVGALADFGPQHLVSDDFEAIENADYVCVFNWAGTKHFGTQLAKTVFDDTKAKGRGKTYYDTADPSPNNRKIPELMRNVLQGEHVDILSVNENEAICYAKQLGEEVKIFEEGQQFEEQAKRSAKILASRLSARIDLHTTGFSATFTKKSETIVSAFKAPVLRATGAGDAWNAGNILGDAYGLSDSCRLSLANTVAAYYISSPNGTHPTRKQLTRFCEKLKRKMTP